ncbi:response regulator [Altererythrobacter aestiaquae]|uniref:Response regulator n=2 Tax=Pontixanthobacter aestiaquae TaxID=1509367 RepID=A0A844Z816_9SPHN|nr:response regulator [Pontixanthobacter aestiaquae]
MAPPADQSAAEPAPSYGRRVAPSVPTAVPSAEQQPRNCLLVDDSRMIRKVARKIVESRGYVTAQAENGAEALEKCKLAMPDLIILDWDMPIMTGIDFLAELRALNHPKRPKVVFCTTHSSVKDIHQAVDVGADEYVTKPFDEASLLAKLEIIGAS